MNVNRLNKKRFKKRNRVKLSLNKGVYPRLVVNRSNKNIFAQLIDDNINKTIISASSIDKDLIEKINKVKSKLEKGIIVGNKIGKLAIKDKIDKIIFDRNGYKYHGRVKALADAIRETGVKF